MKKECNERKPKHGSELPMEILYMNPRRSSNVSRDMLLGTTIKDRADLYITKELIPELRRWKVDTYQVVSIIYKYSDNTRVQARANTEIYEQL